MKTQDIIINNYWILFIRLRLRYTQYGIVLSDGLYFEIYGSVTTNYSLYILQFSELCLQLHLPIQPFHHDLGELLLSDGDCEQ